MKLSEMTTDKAADILILLAAEMQELVNDGELVKKIQEVQKSKDRQTAIKFGMLAALDVTTYLLKTHRQATWNILGAIENKKAEEIGKQLLPITVKQMMDLFRDKDFLSFFE